MKLERRGALAFKMQLALNIAVFIIVDTGIIVGLSLVASKYPGFMAILTWLMVLISVIFAYFTIARVILNKNKQGYGGDEENLCFAYGFPILSTLTVPKRNVVSYKIKKSKGVYRKKFSNLTITTVTAKYTFKLFENAKLRDFVDEHLKGVEHE